MSLYERVLSESQGASSDDLFKEYYDRLVKELRLKRRGIKPYANLLTFLADYRDEDFPIVDIGGQVDFRFRRRSDMDAIKQALKDKMIDRYSGPGEGSAIHLTDKGEDMAEKIKDIYDEVMG